jgi:hypothetical protein
MTREEIAKILEAILPRVSESFDAPSPEDWKALASRFRTRFPEDFVNFIDALTSFEFPGDVYNIVDTGRTNGNDTIPLVHELETKDPAWPAWLIPFYGIGNGDYFCLDARAAERSPVSYWYHERRRAEPYSPCFGDWVRGLPEFLEQPSVGDQDG